MKLSGWLKKHGLQSLKIKAKCLEAEWKPQDVDQQAAWELYIELLTRTATQPLSPEEGCESAALASIHAIFGITRNILKEKGRQCSEFSKIAVVVLNQEVRPFTAKWHLHNKQNAFQDRGLCAKFREELAALQKTLKNYTTLLADIADVEDLTDTEV
jgi:hypothetical protein